MVQIANVRAASRKWGLRGMEARGNEARGSRMKHGAWTVRARYRIGTGLENVVGGGRRMRRLKYPLSARWTRLRGWSGYWMAMSWILHGLR
jgi:hypothetical protein